MINVSVNSKGDVSKPYVNKGVSDVLQVKVDFSLFFGSDTASTLTVTADTGLTVDSSSVASNVATIVLSGGSDCSVYDLNVTLAGTTETKQVIFQVHVRDYDRDSVTDYNG